MPILVSSSSQHTVLATDGSLTCQNRKMAHNIYRCQSNSFHLRLLHRQEAPGLFPPVLQGVQEFQSQWMGGPCRTPCLRADEERLPGYESSHERVQAPVSKRDAEDAAGWRWRRGPETLVVSTSMVLFFDEFGVVINFMYSHLPLIFSRGEQQKKNHGFQAGFGLACKAGRELRKGGPKRTKNQKVELSR